MKTVFLEEMSWKDVEEYLSRQNVILLPVGSIEQSGPHLPLATDSMHVQYVAQKAAQQCQVLLAPSIKWGIGCSAGWRLSIVQFSSMSSRSALWALKTPHMQGLASSAAASGRLFFPFLT